MWRSGARALRSSIPRPSPPHPNPLPALAQAPAAHLLSRSLSSSPVPDAVSSSSPSPPAFSGNLKKALAGLRRIDLEGLRWRVFDAKGQVLGRLASQIATVLQGKDKPTYAPHVEDGDMCIVVNAKDISVTGRKMTDKIYYWHTGYIGHLKERRLKDQMAKDPTEVIRKAVMRMLPRNRLRDVDMVNWSSKLFVPLEELPHHPQVMAHIHQYTTGVTYTGVIVVSKIQSTEVEKLLCLTQQMSHSGGCAAPVRGFGRNYWI